ncbi:uncharacterized protein FRV6_16410 [Fusarium oxysporum]|uniref:Peptidase M20 dimerisation domain-containing protein n=1 Tax=Fusarium oxysporum TaxID=5507 RepID=A0A2H3TUJ7_FUSOX|nr:uncharacterized protein FRV6_16410 [Fusarium oxysporum]
MASTLLGKLMYDALPGAKALVDLKVAGRIRILGTPAEECGGGSPTYKDLQVNDTLSETYVEEMAALGERFMPPRNTLVGEQSPKAFGSTDMGIVSYEVPGLHSAFVVPTPSNVARHNPNFAAAAATDEAHSITIECAKDLAMLAFRVLTDDKGLWAQKRTLTRAYS